VAICSVSNFVDMPSVMTPLFVLPLKLSFKRSAKKMKSLRSSLHLHSIAEVATQIYHGEDPWFSLGSFLHDWWCYGIDSRQDLIVEPPTRATTPEERRWAAFCAATIEELCARTSFPCPAWTNQPDYFLEQPWFYYPQPSQRDWLLSTTPEPFKRRNIFVGGRACEC
jgi:hypothetical protein